MYVKEVSYLGVNDPKYYYVTKNLQKRSEFHTSRNAKPWSGRQGFALVDKETI